MLVHDESTNLFGFIAYCILALIPALGLIFNRKRTITVLVQVGSAGTHVLPQAIADSERDEKSSIAVRVLVLFFKLASMTKDYSDSPSTFQLPCCEGHYTEVLSSEEIAELSKIFVSIFDKRGDGVMSQSEFQDHMSLVGIDISDEQASSLVRAILASVETEVGVEVGCDVKVNGEAALSPEAFFQWYANQLGYRENKKECAEFLFNVFDSDNSGDITVLELHNKLEKLDLGISHDEALELIGEVDHDGNGTLSKKEFIELIEHFWPVEIQYHSVYHYANHEKNRRSSSKI